MLLKMLHTVLFIWLWYKADILNRHVLFFPTILSFYIKHFLLMRGLQDKPSPTLLTTCSLPSSAPPPCTQAERMMSLAHLESIVTILIGTFRKTAK